MAVAALAQNEVVGVWLTQDQDAHVEIYKEGNKYYGKVVWLKVPNDEQGKPRTDIHNDDEKLRNRPIMGLVVMKDFVYDPEDKEWVDGTVYDSKSGNTYSGYLKMLDNGNLYMKGYILGMRFLGRSNEWTRVK
ncbi:MAG: DUF2147 domain-containing protein [Bacteroidetes bacterium]|nr:MAG: DUF2147 domain-containing protein [Bacteroidota bacterium]